MTQGTAASVANDPPAAGRMVAVRGFLLERPGQLVWQEYGLPAPRPGQALVRVAGCGVCHTDLGFYSGAVRPRGALPLALGHEIAGRVEEAPAPFADLVGCDVIVPAIFPCGRCALCEAGRENVCPSQLMPGNDVHGGFATHVVVPASHLVPVGRHLRGHTLAELSAVADAVTTPYQALARARVRAGDLVIVIGVGGIGTFAVQIARSRAAAVAAVDIDPERLARAARLGARWTFDAGAFDGRAMRGALQAEAGVPTFRWKIFEMSGTAAGQELAWSLLAPGATLGVIGFTMDRPNLRLSNLMALDATAFGSWGCPPRLYRPALNLVLSGRVQVLPFVETVPLTCAPELFTRLAAGHAPARRPILLPE